MIGEPLPDLGGAPVPPPAPMGWTPGQARTMPEDQAKAWRDRIERATMLNRNTPRDVCPPT